MKRNVHVSMWGFVALLLAACAGQPLYVPWRQNAGGVTAGATWSPAQVRNAPLPDGRPTQIIVFPLAAGATDVGLNQDLGSRSYPIYEVKKQNPEQLQLAQNTAKDICVKVVSSLAKGGWNAACQPRGTSIDNTFVIDGYFTEIKQGKRLNAGAGCPS